MTGWNMPPGCNPSDIPGNRPEDQAEEDFWTLLDERFIKEYGEEGKKWLVFLEDPDPEDLIYQYVRLARDIAYSIGYSAGQAERFWECVEHKYRNYDNGLGWVCRDCGTEAPKNIAAVLDAAQKGLVHDKLDDSDS